MTEDQFWKIIDSACNSDPRTSEDWASRLTDALVSLPADEIVEWNHIFDRLAAKAYRIDLWAAAYLINGGASDDGFYYFRCWLIGMGREIYQAALADPESLADVATPRWDREGIHAEAEIYAAAHQAWMEVTGNTYDADYPARNEQAELVGREDDWDFENKESMRQHLPRLSALYFE
jgi:hypothetical protein